MLFGSIGANNVGRSEKKAAKRQALGDFSNRHQPAPSRPASDIIEQGLGFHRCIIPGTREAASHGSDASGLSV